MKKLSFLAVIFSAILFSSFSGCEDKVLKFYPTFEAEKEFTVSNYGTFEENLVIPRALIEDQLASLEIPEDGEIESIDIESISLDVTPAQDNKATSVSFTSSVKGLSSVNFSDYVQNFQFPVAAASYKLTGLVSAGVTEMSDQIEKIILTIELPADFTGISVKAKGSSSPSQNLLHFTGKLKVKVSIVYAQKIV